MEPEQEPSASAESESTVTASGPSFAILVDQFNDNGRYHDGAQQVQRLQVGFMDVSLMMVEGTRRVEVDVILTAAQVQEVNKRLNEYAEGKLSGSFEVPPFALTLNFRNVFLPEVALMRAHEMAFPKINFDVTSIAGLPLLTEPIDVLQTPEEIAQALNAMRKQDDAVVYVATPPSHKEDFTKTLEAARKQLMDSFMQHAQQVIDLAAAYEQEFPEGVTPEGHSDYDWIEENAPKFGLAR